MSPTHVTLLAYIETPSFPFALLLNAINLKKTALPSHDFDILRFSLGKTHQIGISKNLEEEKLPT